MSRNSDAVLRDWLLHKLTPKQVERLEEQLLQEGSLSDPLETAEHDLLDDYARGGLSADDASRVEAHVLATPTARQRLAFALTLAELARQESKRLARESSPPSRRVLIVGIAACLVIVALAFLYHSERNPRSAQPLARQAPIPIVLLASRTRGAALRPVPLPRGSPVRLECEIPDGSSATAYRLVLADAAGRSQLIGQSLHPAEAAGIRFVAVALLADQLMAGRYTLSVLTDSAPPQIIIVYALAVE